MKQMQFRATVVALALAALGGCAAGPAATSAQLTYETSPAGATLMENGKSIGVAPVTRTYETNGKPGQITTPDVIAVWPSGAKSVPFFTLLNPGDDRQAVIERPKSAPQLDVDLANAAKVTAQRAAEAQRDKDRVKSDMAGSSAKCQAQVAGVAVRSGMDNCN